MRKVTSGALALLMAVSIVIPATSFDAEARKGRKTAIAAGVILGAAALAIAANSSSAAEQRRFARYCNRLYNRCVNGSRQACYKYETGGCTE